MSVRHQVAGILYVAFWLCAGQIAVAAEDQAEALRVAWPDTDFSHASVDLSEVTSGGPPRDGIPAIDDPVFEPARQSQLSENTPVLTLEIGRDSRAYPIPILMWHEIVNDTVGGTPVAITYCPLCNSGAAFESTINDVVHEFGTTGLLRNSDMIMYDRQTESWWQQFTGEAIAGELTGLELHQMPLRMESFQRFRSRHPRGLVLVPNESSSRPYGTNPYDHYDSLNWPFAYFGTYDGPLPPLARVVAVDGEAWSLDFVRQQGQIETGDLVITWEAGQYSPLDAALITESEDVGNVTVQKRVREGLEDVTYMVPFAFAFRAFNPDGIIHTEAE